MAGGSKRTRLSPNSNPDQDGVQNLTPSKLRIFGGFRIAERFHHEDQEAGE
jgi:hypothetical protein